MSSPELSNNYSDHSRDKSLTTGWFRTGMIVLALSLVVIVTGYSIIKIYIFTPPPNFPVGETVVITEGSSAKSVTKLMQERGFVKSKLALYLSLLWWHQPSDIKASTYRFVTPLSAKDLAEELTAGHFANNLIRLTLIEGERSDQIAKRAKEVLPNFDSEAFITLARPAEGRLFPDTYLIPDSFTASELFELLTDTFATRLAPLAPAINESRLTEEEIIILASIIEREANTKASMRLVSGILQTRLDIGMALQVDASLEYVLEKPLAELTPKDLDLDSPYNTYQNTGLPPTPIGNPGLEAIKAVLEPEASPYLFYITGNDGNFYYARTFDEHRLNIARYLR